MGKYSDRCEAEGIVFIPLIVDTFVGWHKDSLDVGGGLQDWETSQPADWEGGGDECETAAATSGHSVG